MNKLFFSILFIFMASFSLPCTARIVFLHIPKTAGTTLNGLLVSNFNSQDIYPHRKIYQHRVTTYSPKDVSNVLRALPIIDHQLVSGHFPIWFLKEKDPNFNKSYIFTVLREPVDRVLSHWNAAGAEGSPLDKCPNLMCKMLCSDATLTGEELLNDSINNLHRMDFIIFQDDFDNGVRNLFSRLNLTLPKNKIPHRNRSARKEISEKVLNELREINALDVRLYEYANENFRERFRS